MEMRKLINIVENATYGDPIAEFEAWYNAQPMAADIKEFNPHFEVVQLKRSYVQTGDLYIQNISIPAPLQGKGYGKEILAKLIEISEEHRIPLTLESDTTGSNRKWLGGWYRRNGFKLTGARGDYGPFMVRKPSGWTDEDDVKLLMAWRRRNKESSIVENAEPQWITDIFAMPEHHRATIDIDGASLTVAILGMRIPDEERPIGLRHLEVPASMRGQGKATAIFKQLMAAADRYGRPLELEVYPYEERSKNEDGKAAPEQVKALVDAYKRIGFKTFAANPNYNLPVSMFYRPSGKLAESAVTERWMRPYLTGQCYDFALALAEKLPGAEFVGFGSPKYPDHVGLRKDGVYYDVRGAMTEAAFRQGVAGGDGPIIVVDRSAVELNCGVAGVAPPYKGVKEIALARKAVKQAFPKGVK